MQYIFQIIFVCDADDAHWSCHSTSENYTLLIE